MNALTNENSLCYVLGKEIAYRYQDYLALDDEGQYDAALLIYGDYVLSRQRSAANCWTTSVGRSRSSVTVVGRRDNGTH
jgi:hypothetical protein